MRQRCCPSIGFSGAVSLQANTSSWDVEGLYLRLCACAGECVCVAVMRIRYQHWHSTRYKSTPPLRASHPIMVRRDGLPFGRREARSTECAPFCTHMYGPPAVQWAGFRVQLAWMPKPLPGWHRFVKGDTTIWKVISIKIHQKSVTIRRYDRLKRYRFSVVESSARRRRLCWRLARRLARRRLSGNSSCFVCGRLAFRAGKMLEATPQPPHLSLVKLNHRFIQRSVAGAPLGWFNFMAIFMALLESCRLTRHSLVSMCGIFWALPFVYPALASSKLYLPLLLALGVAPAEQMFRSDPISSGNDYVYDFNGKIIMLLIQMKY